MDDHQDIDVVFIVLEGEAWVGDRSRILFRGAVALSLTTRPHIKTKIHSIS